MEPGSDKKTNSSANILIVDDDPICILIAEYHLKNHFKFNSVANGHDALKAIEMQKYDLILMDINLNDHTMDGIMTMRKIRFQHKHKDLKIIAVTASSDAKEWFIKQGFDGHYLKPLAEQTIVEEISKQLDKRIITKPISSHKKAA